MKRVIIIHCWEGYPKYCWYPKTKKELEKNGFKVEVPEMPDTITPKLSKWLPKLGEVIEKPDKDLYLIGHSLGCITILRGLELLKGDETVGGVVLVAGFCNNLGYKELNTFFEKPINYKKIKTHCQKFVAIHSDNDPHVDLSFGDEFKVKLGAKLIVKHNMSHFSGEIDDEESCTSLPEVSKEVLRMFK